MSYLYIMLCSWVVKKSPIYSRPFFFFAFLVGDVSIYYEDKLSDDLNKVK